MVKISLFSKNFKLSSSLNSQLSDVTLCFGCDKTTAVCLFGGRDLVQTVLPEMEDLDPTPLRKCLTVPGKLNYKRFILNSSEYVPETPLSRSVPNIKLFQQIISRNSQSEAFYMNSENQAADYHCKKQEENLTHGKIPTAELENLKIEMYKCDLIR